MKNKNSNQKRNRDDLTGKRAFTDISQLILFIIFISIWILDSFFLKNIYSFAVNISFYIRISIAIIVSSFAIWLIIRGMKIVFSEIRETPHVITKDVFSIVRHPIYLGAILIYFTLFQLTLSIFTSIIFLFAIILYYILSSTEEKELIERFGNDYKEYIQNIPMIIPYRLIFKRRKSKK